MDIEQGNLNEWETVQKTAIRMYPRDGKRRVQGVQVMPRTDEAKIGPEAMPRTNGLEDNLKGEGLFITGDSLSYIWDISSRLFRDEGLIVDTADIISYAERNQVQTDIKVQADIKEGMRKQ
ncbi:hypothetical protein ABEX25_11190 [Paenibacillus thiaminolyticus]|uniref:hypothetical protein n=1 Tax=Paenibacillus thiaminolyticus TaxID=49283 RepID=UPI003D2A4E6A